jgi:hypothetical protein
VAFVGTLEDVLTLIRERGTVADLLELQSAFLRFVATVTREKLFTGSAASALHSAQIDLSESITASPTDRASAIPAVLFRKYSRAMIRVKEAVTFARNDFATLEFTAGDKAPDVVVQRLGEKLQPKRGKALPIAFGAGAVAVGLGVIGMLVVTRQRKQRKHRQIKQRLLGQLVPGGKAEGYHPSQFDPRQLRVGIEIELEHTPDRRVAREIAMDHLVEDSNYYWKLCRWHREAACRLLN